MDIVDKLVVTLGLDASGFKQGTKDAYSSLDGFAAKSDEAGRRIAAGLGVSKEALESWHASAGKLSGANPISKAFEDLGVSVATASGKLRPLRDILVDLSGKFEGLDKAQRAAAGASLGLSQQSIDALSKGKTAVTGMSVEVQKRIDLEKKQHEASSKQSAEQLDRNKKQLASYSKIRDMLISVSSVVGLGGFSELVNKVSSGDASLYRFANLIGVNEEKLRSLQSVIKSFGGTDQDISQFAQNVTTEIANYKATGQTSLIPGLNRLSSEVNFDTRKYMDEKTSTEERIKMMADAVKAYQVQGFTQGDIQYRLQLAGQSNPLINLEMQGRAKIDEKLAQAQTENKADGDSGKLAADRERAFNNLTTAVEGTFRIINDKLNPALTKFYDWLSNFIDKHPDTAVAAEALMGGGILYKLYKFFRPGVAAAPSVATGAAGGGIVGGVLAGIAAGLALFFKGGDLGLNTGEEDNGIGRGRPILQPKPAPKSPLTSDNPAAGYGYFDLMAYNPAEGSGNGIVRAIATLAVSIQHYLWDLQVGLISGMQMLLRPSEAGTVMEIDNYGGSSGASGINGAKLTSDQKKKAAYAVEYLKQKGGWTTNQAVGIVSNLMRESGMNERAVGDHGTSFGLPQLHGSRVNDFRQWSGHDIRNSTLDEQLGFINHELTVGKERRAGDIIRGTQTSDQAARAGTQYYERPRDIAGESNKSAAIARLLGARIDPMAETGASTHMSLRDWSDSVAKRGGTVSSDVRIGTIVIHTAATDARGIAAEIYPAITRTANAYRSDTGLA